MARHGFGIIGCGMIAEFHTRAINEIEGARVVAVCDQFEANGDKIAKLAGGDCRVYDDLDDARPSRTRRRLRLHAERCAPGAGREGGAGGQARRRREAAGDHPAALRRDHRAPATRPGVRLCTIFPSRFSAANLALKTAIDAGRFGRLTLGDTYVKWWRTQDYYDSGGWRGTWELDGGGALMNQAIHNVDLLQWLMGDVETRSRA